MVISLCINNQGLCINYLSRMLNALGTISLNFRSRNISCAFKVSVEIDPLGEELFLLNMLIHVPDRKS